MEPLTTEEYQQTVDKLLKEVGFDTYQEMEDYAYLVFKGQASWQDSKTRAVWAIVGSFDAP